MNFDFRSILEMFEGHKRFLVFLVLAVVAVTVLATVPIAKSYFESQGHTCRACLEENKQLTNHIVEISRLFRQYSAVGNLERAMQATQDTIMETLSYPAPIDNRDLLIEEIGKVLENVE